MNCTQRTWKIKFIIITKFGDNKRTSIGTTSDTKKKKTVWFLLPSTFTTNKALCLHVCPVLIRSVLLSSSTCKQSHCLVADKKHRRSQLSFFFFLLQLALMGVRHLITHKSRLETRRFLVANGRYTSTPSPTQNDTRWGVANLMKEQGHKLNAIASRRFGLVSILRIRSSNTGSSTRSIGDVSTAQHDWVRKKRMKSEFVECARCIHCTQAFSAFFSRNREDRQLHYKYLFLGLTFLVSLRANSWGKIEKRN